MGTSGIQFAGLTGIDTKAIVEQLMKIEALPLQQFQRDQVDTQQRLSLFQNINSRLTSLNSDIEKLSKTSTLNAKKVTSSSESKVSATVNSFTPAGSYTITEITNLATKHSESFVGASDKDAQFASGSFFNFTANGTDYSIDVSAIDTTDQSLEGLRNAINDQAGDDVQAIIINTGDDDDPYKLQLQSKETGEDYRITNISTDINITTASGDVALATVSGEQILGSDAEIVFNGVTIKRGSNTIDDLVEGMTISLHSESTSAIDLTVEKDTSSLKTDIEAFISSYNNMNQVFQDQFSVDPNTGFAGPLSGDATLRQIQSNLQQMVVSGVEDADGNRYSLATIGIEVDKDNGSLSLNAEKFDEAVNNSDTELFLDLFQARGVTESSSMRFVNTTSATTAGVYSVNITSNNGTDAVEGTFTYNGETYTGVGSGQFLTGPEGSPAEGLKIAVDEGVTGNIGTMFVSIGIAEQMERRIDQYVAPITGLLPRLEDQLEADIESLNDQIEAFNERLADRERILTNQFLAAEEAISALQSQQSAFNAQAANL